MLEAVDYDPRMDDTKPKVFLYAYIKLDSPLSGWNPNNSNVTNNDPVIRKTQLPEDFEVKIFAVIIRHGGVNGREERRGRS